MDKNLVEKNEEIQDELHEEIELTEEELEEAKSKVAEEDDEDEDDDDVEIEEAADEEDEEEEKEVKENFKDDLDALVESEATLSEGFRSKAGLIFEAALKTKLDEKVSELEEAYASNLAEETAQIEADLVEKVDGFLSYVVDQWMTENKLAVESGLRAEIAENFMTALHGVFVENYVEVPESKVDLVDELTAKTEELEEKLNTAMQTNIELTESNTAMARTAIISEASADLSVAQAEKLAGLVESVEFEDTESFAEKVETLKASYFKESAPAEIEEDTAIIEEDTKLSPQMQSYVNALNSFK